MITLVSPKKTRTTGAEVPKRSSGEPVLEREVPLGGLVGVLGHHHVRGERDAVAFDGPADAPDALAVLPGKDYKAPRLPAPQDWVLVLERVKL